MLPSLFFYLFAILRGSAFMVIAVKNPCTGAVPDPRLLHAAGLFVLLAPSSRR